MIGSSLHTISDETNQFLEHSTDENDLPEELRVKMRYHFVLGKLDVSQGTKAEKWKQKRKEIEDTLLNEYGIKPSTMI